MLKLREQIQNYTIIIMNNHICFQNLSSLKEAAKKSEGHSARGEGGEGRGERKQEEVPLNLILSLEHRKIILFPNKDIVYLSGLHTKQAFYRTC